MNKSYSMKNLLIVLITILFVCTQFACQQSPQTQGQKESLYARVLRTGEIRCSYASYPPYCIKDPNTGAMSGIFVDVLEEIGKKLELKINWVEEVGWGTIFEGLESDRYDLFGAGLWQNSSRGKRGYFSKPLFYNGIRIWVRANETRIKTLEDINSLEIRLTVQDGAMDAVIADTDFPKAQKLAIPQLNPWSDNLLNTISNKADVSLSELGPITEFLKKNPGTLKEVDIGRPLRVFANCYAFKMGEDKFKSMIDAAIDELVFDGTIEKILQKYETAPGQFLRVAAPYEMK
ncbi:transporter substrate-binding domain-containing protein [bacterium]|nr:transporter substrate-binding domain-containing protein [bacterium]